VRADFYGRKSTKDDGRSVASQEKDFRSDCVDEGHEIGRVFADPDRSASRYARKPRPDYDELLKHIQAGDCELLSLWESSRGSRDLGDWVRLLDLCRKHRVLIRIISHGRTYDVRVRRDWRTLADEGVDSADESEKISERVRRGKRMAAADGRPCARLAYGFIRVYDERGKFVEQIEHPEQAPIVREIVTAIKDGKSSGQIAKRLNARGVPTPLGGPWTDKQVRQIAIKPSYAGLRVHQGEVIGPGSWEPIVDPAIWQAAVAILTAPGRKAKADSTLVHWLTGAVSCGLCGHALGTTPRRGFGTSYACRNCHRVSASARGLESTIEQIILPRLRREDAAELFVPRADIETVRAAMDEEKALRDRLAAFHAEAGKINGLSPAAIAAAERDLNPQIEAAAAKVRRLSAPSDCEELEGIDIAENWEDLSVRTRRNVVRRIADVRLAPGTKGDGPRFNPLRLSGSRWINDERTWGEIWDSLVPAAS